MFIFHNVVIIENDMSRGPWLYSVTRKSIHGLLYCVGGLLHTPQSITAKYELLCNPTNWYSVRVHTGWIWKLQWNNVNVEVLKVYSMIWFNHNYVILFPHSNLLAPNFEYVVSVLAQSSLTIYCSNILLWLPSLWTNVAS